MRIERTLLTTLAVVAIAAIFPISPLLEPRRAGTAVLLAPGPVAEAARAPDISRDPGISDGQGREAGSGDEYRLLDVPREVQSQSKWCWAASARMVTQYVLGNSPEQCDFANSAFGRSDCCANPSLSACNQGATGASQVSSVLSSWSVGSTPLQSSLPFQTIKDELNNERPIIAFWSWVGTNSGHAVVIKGYFAGGSIYHEGVYYNDPGDGSTTFEKYDSFVHGSEGGVEHLWVQTVYGIHNDACDCTDDQVALFVHSYYRGQCIVKGVGEYPNPAAIGLPNDAITSLRVGRNVRAILCRDDGYGGGCETFTADDPNLTDNTIGNDQVSSAKVESRSTPPEPTSTPTSIPPQEGVEILATFPYGHVFSPNQQFTPRVRVRVSGFTLSEARGDHLNNLDGNTFGTWPVQPVRGEGLTEYEFVFSPDMQAPSSTGTYSSRWRLRIGGQYKGPEIVITFGVQDNSPPPSGDWQVEYFNDTSLAGRCATGTSYGPFVFRDWGDGAPTSGCSGDNWSARFTRRVHLDSGSYTFCLGSDDWSRIWVNSDLVVDNWQGRGQHYEGRYLNAGDYDMRIEFADTLGAAKLAAWWRGPGYSIPSEERDQDQWYAEYWGNRDLWWDSVVRRNEGYGFLVREWNMDGPGFGLPIDQFSSRFQRRVELSCGNYRFHVESDDGVRFWIDGQLRLDRWSDGWHSDDVYVDLSSGYHELKLEHYENSGAAAVRLEWLLQSACVTPTPTRTPVVDSQPPAVTWIVPVGNGEVHDVTDEVVALEVNATDDVEVSHVAFWHWDAVNLVWVHLGDAWSAPYRIDLDCRTLNYEWNQITAVAFDTSGNTTERYIWLYRSEPTPTPTQTASQSCPGTDAGDSSSSATVASLPASITEYICPAGDEDWYRLSVSIGQTISISLTDLPADYDLYLYRPDGSPAASSILGGTASEYISQTAESSGDWRVRVIGWNGAYSASQPYLLTIAGNVRRVYLPLVVR